MAATDPRRPGNAPWQPSQRARRERRQPREPGQGGGRVSRTRGVGREPALGGASELADGRPHRTLAGACGSSRATAGSLRSAAGSLRCARSSAASRRAVTWSPARTASARRCGRELPPADVGEAPSRCAPILAIPLELLGSWPTFADEVSPSNPVGVACNLNRLRDRRWVCDPRYSRSVPA